MGQTNLVQLMKSECDFAENVATILIVQPLSCIIEEVNQFDTLHVFHQQVAHVCIAPVFLLPHCVFDKVMVLWNAADLMPFHEIQLCLCLGYEGIFLGFMWFENFHGEFLAIFLNKFDDAMSTLS